MYLGIQSEKNKKHKQESLHFSYINIYNISKFYLHTKKKFLVEMYIRNE